MGPCPRWDCWSLANQRAGYQRPLGAMIDSLTGHWGWDGHCFTYAKPALPLPPDADWDYKCKMSQDVVLIQSLTKGNVKIVGKTHFSIFFTFPLQNIHKNSSAKEDPKQLQTRERFAGMILGMDPAASCISLLGLSTPGRSGNTKKSSLGVAP